uniref:Reverse transcriptase domain-containing protein n=1 Tax=Angiostrongylus cantonensis TaxID=6313 RepID=A0A0K0CWZ4_ANGCA
MGEGARVRLADERKSKTTDRQRQRNRDTDTATVDFTNDNRFEQFDSVKCLEEVRQKFISFPDTVDGKSKMYPTIWKLELDASDRL